MPRKPKAAKKSRDVAEYVLPEETPNMGVYSGTDTFRANLYVKKTLQDKEKQGWQVIRLSGSQSLQIREELAAEEDDGFFEPKKRVILVTDPERLELSVLQEHVESKNDSVILLLFVEGDVRKTSAFGKFIAPMKNHRVFKAPPVWKAEEDAVEFVLENSKRCKLDMTVGAQELLVRLAGTDLGVLSFEIEKLAHLGITQIKPDHVRHSVAVIAEASIQPIIDALAVKNAKALLTSLEHFKRTRKDPLIYATEAISWSVMDWYRAASILDAKSTPEMQADILGVKPWVYKNKMLGPARLYGTSGTSEILQALANARRGLLSGTIDPWAFLCASLLSVCSK